jgi:hypothetical protein
MSVSSVEKSSDLRLAWFPVDVSKSLSEFANEAFAASYLEVAKAYKEESTKNKYFYRHPGETDALYGDRGHQAGMASAFGLGVAGLGLGAKGHFKSALAANAAGVGAGLYGATRGRKATNKWREENGYAPRSALTGIPKKNKMKSDNTSATSD